MKYKQYKIKLMHDDKNGNLKYDILEYTFLTKAQVNLIKEVLK